MNKYHVTAIMPLRNHHPDFLKKSIESMLVQTSPYWYLLIIVEKKQLQKFQKLLQDYLVDKRIDMIVNQGRKLAGAINTGMRSAKTEFAAILLSDDMWAPKAVTVLNTYVVQNPEVDFFHSSRKYFNEKGDPISSVYRSREHFSVKDFKDSSPVKHLLCWNKEMALSFGGLDETLNSVGPDDWDFPWTMAEQGAIFKAITECLYYYRDHRAAFRLTTHLPLNHHKRETRRILEKHGVAAELIEQKIARAEQTYLRQCLYKSKFDKWLKRMFSFNGQNGYKQPYK